LERLEQTIIDKNFDRGNLSDGEDIDVRQIKKTIKRKTTREALIDARRGQGKFRAEVGERWKNVCALTGCGIAEVLRASHIKPWRSSTNPERLDPENGLLLAAHADALFDGGLITFAGSGAVLISTRIDLVDRKQLHLPAKLRRRPTKREAKFLDFRRRHVFDRE
jgi:HNH endonuclease